MSPNVDPIVATLRAERQRQRLSLAAVGARLNGTHQTIWQWESGRHDPKLQNLRAWADALGYDVALVRRAR